MSNPTEARSVTGESLKHEPIGRWVRITAIKGGWMVRCRLCGKHSKRTFMASVTNYAEAERASRDFAPEHLESDHHRAALDAYFSDEVPSLQRHEELLLSKAFGIPVPAEQALRRRAAKAAAQKGRWEAQAAKQREAALRQPKCALCGHAVSVKEDRADDRAELPSGALIHTKCVA